MTLFRFLGAGFIGALLGWLATETWQENLSFFEDFLLLFAVSLGIAMVMILEKFFFNFKFTLFIKTLINPAIYLAVLFGVILIKLYYYSLPQKIVIEGKDQTTEARVLLLDVSGSMSAGMFQWEAMVQLKKAVSNYLQIQDQVGSQDNIGCVAFSDQAYEIMAPARNYQALAQQIQHLQPLAGTQMNPGFLMAKRMLEQDSLPKEIILVSDGMPEDKEETLNTIRQFHGIKIDTIGVGPGYDAA